MIQLMFKLVGVALFVAVTGVLVMFSRLFGQQPYSDLDGWDYWNAR